jgi:hypothetical protein
MNDEKKSVTQHCFFLKLIKVVRPSFYINTTINNMTWTAHLLWSFIRSVLVELLKKASKNQ